MTPPSWLDLVTLMTEGPDGFVPRIHGVIRSTGTGQAPGNQLGWAVTNPADVPLMTAGTGELQVWRDGDRVRVQDEVGGLVLSDGTHAWRVPGDGRPAWVAPAANLRFQGTGTHLLRRRTLADLLGGGMSAGPATATRFLGRDAWTVEVALTHGQSTLRHRRPTHGPVLLVIDAATGWVLQQRVDDIGAVDGFTAFDPDPDVGDVQFDWAGPADRWPPERRPAAPVTPPAPDPGLAWFEREVGPLERHVVADVRLDLEFQWLHEHDDEGGFAAVFSVVDLERRPLSDDPWETTYRSDGHRWRDARHEWKVSVRDLAVVDHSAVERHFARRDDA